MARINAHGDRRQSILLAALDGLGCHGYDAGNNTWRAILHFCQDEAGRETALRGHMNGTSQPRDEVLFSATN